MIFRKAILTHGGAGSSSSDSDGPKAAAQLGIDILNGGGNSLDTVTCAVKFLEDDPRFNAGFGSQIRSDGKRIQLDAACMTSSGQFGAVACVEGVQNPIEIARAIALTSPHILFNGEGALIFAKEKGLQLKPMSHGGSESKSVCDTVGAIAFDGENFSSALSSGGLAHAAIGRVGDVPLPGCGLYCGPRGAIACTGDGEFIALKVLAREIYNWIENNMSASDASSKALTLFDDSVDVGVIILTPTDFAASSKNDMAWSKIIEGM